MGLLLVGADWGVRLASLDILRLVGQAGWIVKLVLLALAVASVVSWAIIAFKWRELRRAAQDARRSSRRITGIVRRGTKSRDLEHSPITKPFSKRVGELAHRMQVAAVGDRDLQRRAVERQIPWTAARETHRLERGLSSSRPAARRRCRPLRHGDLALPPAFGDREGGPASPVVAPGIAEALIATPSAPPPRSGRSSTTISSASCDASANASTCSPKSSSPICAFAARVRPTNRARRGPSAMGAVRRGGAVMSEINVTPFVDVMLVLLIIFMVTAPLMQQGIDVDLPQTHAALRLTRTAGAQVQRDGKTFLGKEIASGDLEQCSPPRSRGDKELYLRGPRRTGSSQGDGGARNAGATQARHRQCRRVGRPALGHGGRGAEGGGGADSSRIRPGRPRGVAVVGPTRGGPASRGRDAAPARLGAC
jgi:biopolymer transport protein ExbD